MNTELPLKLKCANARQIIDKALEAATDVAILAGISAECFVAAVLCHACAALTDHFAQSPDDIGQLARNTAALYAAARLAKH